MASEPVSPIPERVFLITGASSGIGAATARAAAAAGFRLVLAARSQDKLDALVEELGGTDRAIAVPTDVTSFADNEALTAAALRAFGRLDVVFVNAGFGGKRSFGSNGDSPEKWEEMVLTNVLGAAYTVRATLDPVTEAKGHVLLTGSVAGRIVIPGSLYSATKWAVTGIGQNLRAQLSGTGVRVTLIEPGMVDTPFFDDRPDNALHDVDIAGAVMYAVSQPPHVDVNEILVRPAGQSS